MCRYDAVDEHITNVDHNTWMKNVIISNNVLKAKNTLFSFTLTLEKKTSTYKKNTLTIPINHRPIFLLSKKNDPNKEYQSYKPHHNLLKFYKNHETHQNATTFHTDIYSMQRL